MHAHDMGLLNVGYGSVQVQACRPWICTRCGFARWGYVHGFMGHVGCQEVQGTQDAHPARRHTSAWNLPVQEHAGCASRTTGVRALSMPSNLASLGMSKFG